LNKSAKHCSELQNKLISNLNIAISITNYSQKGDELDKLFSQESEISIKIDSIYASMIKSDLKNLIDVSLRNLAV